MARKKVAGLLLFRRTDAGLEVFLAHPGGPFWTKKDLGAWSIPKGEIEADEEPLRAAQREFHEETGCQATGHFIALHPIKQPDGKLLQAWALEGDCDANAITSNCFSIEWPPRSGQTKNFPEVDRAAWFTLDVAKQKIRPVQLALLEELERLKD